MASKKNKIQEVTIPEERQPNDETLTYRGAETILGGADINKPLVSFTETGGVKYNWSNVPYYKPSTAVYDKKLGAISAEALSNPEYVEQMSNDIADMYGFVNPYLRDDKRRNAIVKQIYNEISSVPGYIGQGALSMGINAYDAILSLNRGSAEKDWQEYISNFDQNDPDVQNLYVALNNATAQGFNPLYMSAKKLKGIDGKPLSDKSLEIYDKYRSLLQKRQDDAYRQKALEIFEQTDPVALGGRLGEDIEGDKSTVGHILTQLAAKDVAGSVAVAWTTGQAWMGVTKAAAKLFGTARKIAYATRANSAYMAARNAQKILSLASATGAEAAVATPVFLSQYNQIRNLALTQGLSYSEASSIAFIAGAAEAGLEFAGFKFFKRLYARDGIIWNKLITDIIPEALQETSQTIAENIITQTTGLTEKTFSDIMYEIGMSALGGAIGGSMFSDFKTISSRMVATNNWAEKRLSKFSKQQQKQAVQELIQEKSKITTEQTQEQKIEIPFKEDTSVPLPQVTVPTETQQQVEQPEQKEEVNQEPAPMPEESQEIDWSYGETKEGKAELKQTIDELYGQYFDLYKELALKKNKKLTEEQLINGFKGVAAQVQLANSGELGEAFDNTINNAVAWIPAANASVKANAKKIDELLTKKGYSQKKSKEIRQRLLSPDWATKHDAQWEMAEDVISDMFEEAGLKEYAPLAYKQLRGLMYDFTFMVPEVSIVDLLEKQRFNLYNLQIASLLYNQSLPNNATSMLSNTIYIPDNSLNADTGMSTFTRNDINERVNVANNVTDMLENPKENALEINKQLYGENIDKDASKTNAEVNFLAQVEEKVLYNSPFTTKQELTSRDFKRMALMRKMGISQAEIMNQFNIETSDSEAKQYPEEAYQDTLNRLYPEPDEDTLRAFSEMQEQDNTIEGLFSPDTNTAVVSGKSGMAAVHEFSHYSLTNFMTRILEAQNIGLLPDNIDNQAINNIINLQNYLRAQIAPNTKRLTEAQFQETLNEAMQQYYNGQVNSDSKLQELLSKTDEAFQMTVADGINQSVYKSLPEEKKFMLDSAIANMLENNTPTTLMKKANALEDISFNKIDVGGSTAEERVDNLYNSIMDVIDNSFVPNGDKFAATAELMKNTGNYIGLMSVALDVSNAAKEFVFKTLYQNESDKVKKQTPLTGAYGDNQTESFRYQTAVLPFPSNTSLSDDTQEAIKDIRDMSGQEIWQKALAAGKATGSKIVDGIKDIVQSISSAAYSVDNTLGSMIERSYYDLGKQVMEVKKEAAKLQSLIEPKLGKDGQKYTQWVMMFADAGKVQKANSVQFLKDNVSQEAAYTFESMWNRLADIKTQLISVGLSAEIFYNDDYWPQSVKNHRGLMELLGSPEVKSDTTKLVDRLFYNAVREQAIKKNYKIKEGETLDAVANKVFNEEEKKQLYRDIVNKANGFFRENIDDSHKVSSFFSRIVLQKTIDMMQFYYDPITSYVKYCESMYRTIMMRQLTGFVSDNTNTKQTGKIGRYIISLPRDTVTQEALSNFDRKFKKFVNVYKSEPDSLWNYMRQINNITTLGSFVNTINQTMDFVPFIEQFGANNVKKAISDLKKGIGVKIADIGVESSSETYRTAVENEGLKKAQQFVWEKTKFASMDEFVKNTGINAAKNYFMEALSKDENNPQYKEAMAYIDECFPDNAFIDILTEQPARVQEEAFNTRQAVIADLKAGKATNDTGFVLFHMLGKTQPINPSVTSVAAVAGSPIAKLCMQFTAPMLRQLEWLTSYIKIGAKTRGGMWAAKELLRLAAFLMMIGLPKEIVTNAIRGRKTDILKAGALAPLHIIGVNEYVFAIAKRDGIFQAISSTYRPGFNVEFNATKDLIGFFSGKDYQGNLVKNIPVLGDAVYGWFLGGRQQSIKMKTNLIGNDLDDVKNAYKNAKNNLRSF